MSKNTNTSGCTKHVDTRYHYVRDCIQDGFVTIDFVRSQDNVADLFTKNLPSERYELLLDKFMVKNRKGLSVSK